MKKRVYSGDRSGKNRKSEWTYFDNCVICQGMKKTDKEGRALNEKELKELFRKANESN